MFVFGFCTILGHLTVDGFRVRPSTSCWVFVNLMGNVLDFWNAPLARLGAGIEQPGAKTLAPLLSRALVEETWAYRTTPRGSIQMKIAPHRQPFANFGIAVAVHVFPSKVASKVSLTAGLSGLRSAS